MEKNISVDAPDIGIDSTGAKIQSGVSHASEAAHKKIDSIVDAAQPAVSRMSDGAHNVVDKVAGAAIQAAQKVETSGQQLRNTEEKVVNETSKYVRENPITSLAIAVGAGFLISRLLSSR